MKKIYKVFLASTILIVVGSAYIALTKPSNPIDPTDYVKRGFTQVQTSGPEKAWVGEWKGDDTVIIDPLGNETTVGELKKASSVMSHDENLIKK